MARIRYIKPDFFFDENIAELKFSTRIAYQGLWVNADKCGRIEDSPRKLKALIFPYDDVDMEEALQELTLKPFIHRYEVNGKRYIEIINFNKHQKVHHTEKESVIPQYAPIHVKHTLKDGEEKEGMGKGIGKGIGMESGKRQAEYSASFVEKAEKAKGLGVNIYQLIGFYKKRSKVCEPIPEPVLDRVLDSVVKYAPKGDKFPYFLQVLGQESMRYFSESNVKMGNDYKKPGLMALSDIMEAAIR